MMRTPSVIIIALFCAALSRAQTAPTADIYAVGGSYASSASPSIAGSAMVAHLMTPANTWAFAVFDALPPQAHEKTIGTSISMGVAQQIGTILGVKLFVPTAAGISYTGSNTGWEWTTGVLGSVPLGKSRWRLLPNVRFLKASVGNQGVETILGLWFGSTGK